MITSTGEWTPYLESPPDTFALVRFWDERIRLQWTGYARELPAKWDRAYLWWKLTGLERFKGELP